MTKSVLSSLSSHNMITNRLNNTYLEKLNALVKKFILAKDNDRKGLHLINWNTMIKPKNMGGLYIKDLKILRPVINGKRILDLLNNSDKLWVKICKAEYGVFEPTDPRRLKRVS